MARIGTMPSNRASRDRRKRPVIYLRLLNTCGDHPVVCEVLNTPNGPCRQSAESPLCVGCEMPFADVSPHSSSDEWLSTVTCDECERTWQCDTTVETWGSSGRAFQI